MDNCTVTLSESNCSYIKMILKVDPDVISLNEKYLYNQKKNVFFLITSITNNNYANSRRTIAR